MYAKGALMLHTLRNVISDDSLWFVILKGIQHDFQYKSITTQEIIDYINQKTDTDYSYFFNQYLAHTVLPELQISIRQEKGKSVMKYRWEADEPNFRMPVKIEMSDERSDFIYPTGKWQSMALGNNQIKEIKVDKDFYIKKSILYN